MLFEATNTPAMARTSNLNEELGQVSLTLHTEQVKFISLHDLMVLFDHLVDHLG